LTLDFSGCELRILTEMSGDPVWKEAFVNEWDLHSYGAELLFEDRWKIGAEPGCAYYEKDHAKCKCRVHKAKRDEVKAINFGLCYGMGSSKLADSLKIGTDEASDLLEKYKSTFPTVTTFLNRIGESAQQILESRSLSGRRRRWKQPTWDLAIEKAKVELGVSIPTSEQVRKVLKGMFASINREGKNGPIQASNADMAKRAMYLAWLKLEPQFGAHIVNMVHDELVVECPEENVEECYKFVSECMSNAGGEFVKSIPMPTEGHIEDCWTK
jgi:DNA polymerase-1